MAKYTHDELKQIMLSDPITKNGYDELEEEFALFNKMLKARISAGKTQEDVAKSLNTTTSVISRLENSGGKKCHSPTLQTLRKYAKALNCDLKIQFIPHKS